ncbi:exosortase F system-associated membrane protein [Ascidiimonas aurantiaca]|uniref:exosortase F system-associated membrane protein n=1 Tax=Ascidiimonas aurantiaca TaxID=1685432 RepID=UPI0030ED99E7
MRSFLRYGTVAVALILLVVIRAFEDIFFYDPFLEFFKGPYHRAPLPKFFTGKLLMHITLRYGMNMLLSLLILYALFRNRALLKFSSGLYAGAFLVFTGVYFLLLHIQVSPEYYLVVFYIRRFLIQPLLLFILVPAFYYQYHRGKTR